MTATSIVAANAPGVPIDTDAVANATAAVTSVRMDVAAAAITGAIATIAGHAATRADATSVRARAMPRAAMNRVTSVRSSNRHDRNAVRDRNANRDPTQPRW